MHRAHSSVEVGSASVFVRAPRRPASDLISTAFKPLSVASVLGSSVLPRFALLPVRMRAAVASGLIVRGLGNFRRVGVAGGGTECLSVVRRFRTVIVRVRVRTYTRRETRVERAYALAPYVRKRASIYCVVFQRANPSRRYLNAHLALETSSPLLLSRLYMRAIA